MKIKDLQPNEENFNQLVKVALAADELAGKTNGWGCPKVEMSFHGFDLDWNNLTKELKTLEE